MQNLDHNVNPCAAVPHVISSLTVVRCSHREAYTVTAWTSIQSADDDVDSLFSKTIEFGPFDTIEEISRQVGMLAHELALRASDVVL